MTKKEKVTTKEKVNNKLSNGMKRDRDEFESEQLRTKYGSEYDIMRALHLH